METLSRRAILAVRVQPAVAGAQARLDHLLRYLARPEASLEASPLHGLEDLARCVHRLDDPLASRLFQAAGAAGGEDARRLSAHVATTSRRLYAYPRWHGQNRAYYSLVISPEDGRGLDLARLTRKTMARLQRDAGELPPWLAASHHDRAHPHVHVVLAAQRRLDQEEAKTLLITKARLARMKAALAEELSQQRDRELKARSPLRALTRALSPDPLQSLSAGQERGRRDQARWLQLER